MEEEHSYKAPINYFDRSTYGRRVWETTLILAIVISLGHLSFSISFPQIPLEIFQAAQFIWVIFFVDFIFRLRSPELLKPIFYENEAYKKRKGPKEFKQRAQEISVDALSSVPYEFLVLSFDLPKGLLILGLVRLLKIPRILYEYAVPPRYFRILITVSGALLALHWIACGWAYFHPAPEREFVDFYIYCVYWTITTLTTIGYGDITPTTTVGRLFTMFVMILGVGLYGLVIGNISRFLNELQRYKDMGRERIEELQMFLRYYQIPPALQRECLEYYRGLYEKRLTENDEKIISDLPKALQRELQTYMSIKLVSSLPIFQNCSHTCLKEVVENLNRNGYSPGKQIIHEGEDAKEMYIIAHGVIQIKKNNKVVATLEEGQVLGEHALLMESQRTANAYAVSYVDLYQLEKSDFDHLTTKYPILRKNVEAVCEKRQGMA